MCLSTVAGVISGHPAHPPTEEPEEKPYRLWGAGDPWGKTKLQNNVAFSPEVEEPT